MDNADYEKQKRAYKLCTQLAPYSWNNFAKSLIDFFNEKSFLTIKQIEAGETMLEKAKANNWTQGDEPIPVMPLVGQKDNELPGEVSQPATGVDYDDEPF